MANRRDETLAVLQQLGLTKDEAEEEISYREAEAERLLDEADEAERAEAAKQARAHLFATTPFYIVPRRRPAAVAAPRAPRPTTPVSTEATRPPAFVPATAPQTEEALVAAPAATALSAQSAADATQASKSAIPTDSVAAVTTEPEAAPAEPPVIETATPAVANALRSMAIAVASSRRVITPPAHTNGNGATAPAKPDEPLGLRLPRTPSHVITQNGALRARVETPIVEPLPVEIPAPVVVTPSATAAEEPAAVVEEEAKPSDITKVATPVSQEVATLAPSTTMTADSDSSATGAAAEAEAQPLLAHSNGAEPNVAIESPIDASLNVSAAEAAAVAEVAAEASSAAPNAAAETVVESPVVEASAALPAEPAVEAPAAEASADPPAEPTVESPVADGSIAQPTDAEVSVPTAAEPEPTTQLPLAAVVTTPEAIEAATIVPGQKPARLSRKKRRELAAAEAALAAEKNPKPATKSGGLLGPFKRYGRWTFRGPKWHFALGLVAPVLVIALIAAAFGQTQGWYSSSSPAQAQAAGPSLADPALSNKAYTNYVLAMEATLNSYGASVDTINRIANQPLSSNPGWANQLNGAAGAIKDAGQNLRKVGVPLCVANSHHTFMVGVTNMDNAADNLVAGLRDSSPDDLTTSASLINSAKPLLQQASAEIKATKC